jgi:hypothetical protein
MHKYIHTYIQPYTHTCMHAYTHTRIYHHTKEYRIIIHTNEDMYLNDEAYLCECVCVHTHTYMHTYIHKYSLTRQCVHVAGQNWHL